MKITEGMLPKNLMEPTGAGTNHHFIKELPFGYFKTTTPSYSPFP